MKPILVRIIPDNKIILTFSSEHLVILKDNTVYRFLSIEGNEIIINKGTRAIENLDQYFVFSKGIQLIRVSIKELLESSNFYEHLFSILEELKIIEKLTDVEIENTLKEVEKFNILNAIDIALGIKDRESFHYLSSLL